MSEIYRKEERADWGNAFKQALLSLPWITAIFICLHTIMPVFKHRTLTWSSQYSQYPDLQYSPYFSILLLQPVSRLQKAATADSIIAKSYRAAIFLAACCTAGNPVHVLSADGADFFQHIYHTVNCGRSNISVFLLHLVINLLTAGTLLLQNNIQYQLALSGDPAALFA